MKIYNEEDVIHAVALDVAKFGHGGMIVTADGKKRHIDARRLTYSNDTAWVAPIAKNIRADDVNPIASPPILRVWPPKERARRRPDPIKLRRARKGRAK